MTTPVHIEADLVRQVEKFAAERGQSVDQFVSAALTAAMGTDRPAAATKVTLPEFTGRGDVLPGIDLNDARSLRRILDEPDGDARR